MTQELKRFRVKDPTKNYGTATWFEVDKSFDQLQTFISELNADGYRVVSIVPLKTQGFHNPGRDELTTTDFAILCEKE